MNTKRLVPLAIVGAIALSLAACGDDDDEASDTTSAPAATAAPATPAAPVTSAAAATTAAPATSGEPATSAAPATTAGSDTTMAMDGDTVTVEGVDYAFENLPESVPAGTLLEFTNTSDVEVHELAAIRIPDEETRPVEELIQLPEEEIDAILGDTMPAAVIIAAPGETGMAVVGDGTMTEPGRYAVVCFIPIGADPDEFMAAIQTESSGPPEVAGGPPHVTAGMYAELVVEEA